MASTARTGSSSACVVIVAGLIVLTPSPSAAAWLRNVTTPARQQAPRQSKTLAASNRRRDNKPPSVTITQPASGASVSGTVTVTAAASDNVGVAGVQFKLDGSNLGVEDTSAPYTISWSTNGSTPVLNGAHTLIAVARDAAGNTHASSAVTINVANGADTAPPTVSITAPASGALVSGTVTITAIASDNVGVSGVRFLIDGGLLSAEDTTAPYSASWNTTTSTQGLHSLVAVARDAAGNVTNSAPVSVTAANSSVDFTFAWDPNPEPDIAGYKIYFGTASGVYSSAVNVGNVTSCTITGFQPGALYYFAATAYNSSSVESGFSAEITAMK